MQIEVVNTYDELSKKAKDYILQEIKKNKSLLLCAATGSSPTGTYQFIAEEYKNNPDLFADLRIVKLDEWGGISLDNPATCESYLQSNLIQPLNISGNRYFGFDSNPADPQKECDRIQQKIENEGPIDLCILGIGTNGHLALNEPGSVLHANCHEAQLTEKSLQHSMIKEIETKPNYGLALGMADIFQSKMILLLISGVHKKDIVKKFLSKKINTELPASLLWMHPNVFCLIEKDTMPETVGSK